MIRTLTRILAIAITAVNATALLAVCYARLIQGDLSGLMGVGIVVVAVLLLYGLRHRL